MHYEEQWKLIKINCHTALPTGLIEMRCEIKISAHICEVGT